MATREQQLKVVDDFFELVVLNMAVGEDVTIRGLGRFETRIRRSVRLKNAHDGTPVDTGDRVTMIFKPSMKVKERLNAVPL